MGIYKLIWLILLILILLILLIIYCIILCQYWCLIIYYLYGNKNGHFIYLDDVDDD